MNTCHQTSQTRAPNHTLILDPTLSSSPHQPRLRRAHLGAKATTLATTGPPVGTTGPSHPPPKATTGTGPAPATENNAIPPASPALPRAPATTQTTVPPPRASPTRTPAIHRGQAADVRLADRPCTLQARRLTSGRTTSIDATTTTDAFRTRPPRRGSGRIGNPAGTTTATGATMVVMTSHVLRGATGTTTIIATTEIPASRTIAGAPRPRRRTRPLQQGAGPQQHQGACPCPCPCPCTCRCRTQGSPEQLRLPV